MDFFTDSFRGQPANLVKNVANNILKQVNIKVSEVTHPTIQSRNAGESGQTTDARRDKKTSFSQQPNKGGGSLPWNVQSFLR